MSRELAASDSTERIAIIGMSGRFPKARHVAELWQNFVDGVSGISFFTDEELEASGVDVASVRGDSSYVRARGIIADADKFDARFFGMNPREAQVMDPQHRVLLEEAWLALENAGYDPAQVDGLVGVYAGQAKNTYFRRNLLPNLDTIEAVDGLVTELGNIPDYLTTRISYKLDLRGPSVTVHTACSTSLVAIYHACQSLLNFQCDMALAGGVTILFPQRVGHWSTEGDIQSPDGFTRTFDAEGQGTVFSDGAAMVVLKRLEDAQRDHDRICAVIRGIAINNDGAAKAGFGAPSVEGQTDVIAMAHAVAGVHPRDISYVECHGTATPLGDPIEVAALTRAFRAHTDDIGFCALGSAKSNLGHLDAAAGATGVIKTALALQHRQLPATLHFRTPNPKFDIERTPFFVNDRLRSWETNGKPRIAGVSSFGVGGTNAHAILEEAPPATPSGPSRTRQLIVLSAKTETAADEACRRLADHLDRANAAGDVNVADVAFTLQRGRHGLDHRRIVVGSSSAEIAGKLRDGGPALKRGQRTRRDRPVIYLLPGQGAQYPNMGRVLYDSEPTFRQHVDAGAEVLQAHLGMDLRGVLYPKPGAENEAARLLRETSITQPALFVIEYALAQLWMEWGVRPTALVGHSIGEFVAACLASVLTFEDALGLLARRGRLMHDVPAGGMMAVPLPEDRLRQVLPVDLSIAAINSPSSCVVSGPHEAIDAFEQTLVAQETVPRKLHTSHAFHSAMMDPVVEAFATAVAEVALHPPAIPFTSSVTGRWVTATQATDPGYWARHLRQAVRFADARQEVAEIEGAVLLEVGPGSTLSGLANHPAFRSAKQRAVSSLGHALDERDELECLLETLGIIWIEGVSVDWRGFWQRERRARVELPSYPFERRSFWIAPPTGFHPDTTAKRTVSDDQADIPSAPEITAMPVSPGDGGPDPQREQAVLSYIMDVMQDLGGLEPEDVDPNATFLDLGFDSLFLTQAGLALKKKFDVKITLRQLLEDAPTPQALARHIAGQLPPDALPVAPGPSAHAVPSTSAPPPGLVVGAPLPPMTPLSGLGGAPSSLLEETVRQQLQLMAMQLQALSGQVPAGAPAPASTAASRSPAPRPDGSGQADRADSARGFGPWKPISKQAVSGLDAKRERALADLVHRYTARTPSSKALTSLHRPHLADPRSASGFRTTWKEMVYPIAAARSRGSRLWDIDGNEYIDLRSGFGSVLFGHSPDFVTQAVTEQLALGVQIGPTSPKVGEVAKGICELTGMERVTFCNTGSEAVMAAMRVARTVTGRDKIVVFSHDYHGMFDEVLVRGSGRGDAPVSRPIAPGIPTNSVANMVVLDYGSPDALAWIGRHGSEIAAVLVEPVQSRHPDFQPRDFLHQLRRLTRETESVLIFDEVITGFRLHPGGAQAWYGIEADLATYGKIIGGGMPIGVVAGRAAFMDALDGGQWRYGDASFPEVGVTYFAGTFQRHPLAIAAAAAVVRHLQEAGPELQRSVGEKCRHMVDTLSTHFARVGAPIHIERCESMFSFVFQEEHEFTSLFYYYLRERGVNIWEGGASFLTTAHSDADLATVVEAVKATVADMQEAGFLARAAELPTDQQVGGPTPTRRIPLTEAQREIWLACQMGDDANCAYNESDTLELIGSLDVDALRRAVWSVLARHDGLHVRFDDEGACQEFHEPAPLDIAVHDFSAEPAETQGRKVEELLVKLIATDPFDLTTGPLLRSFIVQLAEDHHLFVLAAHHLVVDGWSAGVLLDEIGETYSALRRAEPTQLAPAPSFAEYVRLEETARTTPVMEASLRFWTDLFTPMPAPADLPLDRPRPGQRSFRGATVKRVLRPSVYEAARTVASTHGATMFVTLLSAYQVLLYRLSGHGDVVVGMPTAGQAISGMTGLVGHCVNLLPVRSRMSGDLSAGDFINTLKYTVLDAYEHQECTFGSIVRALAIERDPGRLPLVEVIFNLNRDRALLRFDGLVARFHENPRRAVNFDLFFNIYDGAGGLVVDLDYNTDLFDEATIERWIAHYEHLLEAMAKDPRQSLDSLPLMSDEEMTAMVARSKNPAVTA